MAELIMQEEGSNPSTPSSGKWKAFFKSDGLYMIEDNGTVTGPFVAKALTDTLYQAINKVPDSFRTKYIITPSIASNNLTLAIKYVDGNDPTATNKIVFRVGNTEYTLSAAVSFTKNAGTNWCNAGGAEMATNPIDFFVYAIGETGASAGLKFGFSRIPNALTMGDFVNTNTSEKYIAGNWTNFNATDSVTVIGRFRAQLSAAASYNWSIATSVVVNRPIYETDWLNWTPVYSASGSMTYTSVSTTVARYMRDGKNVFFHVRATGTTGGTASTALQATLPFESANVAAQPPAPAFTNDSAVGNGFAFLSAGTPDFVSCRKYDSSNWGLAASKTMNVNSNYEAE